MKLLTSEEWSGPTTSAFITCAFKKVLIQTKLSIDQINIIALGTGPGRFTGVRMGISFAKTLAFCSNAILYPFSSLRILAASTQINIQPTRILTLVNAFKNSVYLALYHKENNKVTELIKPQVLNLPLKNNNYISNNKSTLSIEKLDSYIMNTYFCIGDGYKAYESLWPRHWKKQLTIISASPHISGLAQIYKEEFNNLKPVSWQQLQPIYLRSPVPILKIK